MTRKLVSTAFLALLLYALVGTTLPVGAEPTNEETIDEATRHRIGQLIDNLVSTHERIRAKAEEELDMFGFATLEQLEEAANDATNAPLSVAANRYLSKLNKHEFKILDAFGEPIAGASVVITPSDRSGKIKLKTNPLGNIQYRHHNNNNNNARHGNGQLRVAHKNYGVADIQISLRNQKPTTLRFPLVADDHPATDRTARGRVVDPEGKGVPDVVIRCGSVRTPGEGLITGDVIAVTDQEGAFRFYLIANDTQQRGTERGELIPPGSDAICWLSPPKEAGLWRFAGRIDNNEQVTITLDRPKLKHTTQVEAPNGGFVQPGNERDRV